MEQQEQTRPQEQGERTTVCCCPVCGGRHHAPWGHKARRHMMYPGMMPYAGPWGWHHGPCMAPMGMGLMYLGPALLGFAIGILVGRKAHY